MPREPLAKLPGSGFMMLSIEDSFSGAPVSRSWANFSLPENNKPISNLKNVFNRLEFEGENHPKTYINKYFLNPSRDLCKASTKKVLNLLSGQRDLNGQT